MGASERREQNLVPWTLAFRFRAGRLRTKIFRAGKMYRAQNLPARESRLNESVQAKPSRRLAPRAPLRVKYDRKFWQYFIHISPQCTRKVSPSNQRLEKLHARSILNEGDLISSNPNSGKAHVICLASRWWPSRLVLVREAPPHPFLAA
jgi:hypothetical protein